MSTAPKLKVGKSGGACLSSVAVGSPVLMLVGSGAGEGVHPNSAVVAGAC